jgi:hypothetical protein
LSSEKKTFLFHIKGRLKKYGLEIQQMPDHKLGRNKVEIMSSDGKIIVPKSDIPQHEGTHTSFTEQVTSVLLKKKQWDSRFVSMTVCLMMTLTG